MGMDLSGKGGYFRWNIDSWRRLLSLAERHGWEPMGTTLPEEILDGMSGEWWGGEYMSNSHQVVHAEDSERMAAALERALPAIPEVDALAPYCDEDGEIVLDTDYFCGPEPKDYIRKFIVYCRAGKFRIG